MVDVKDLCVLCKSLEMLYIHQKMDETSFEGWIGFVKNNMHKLQIIAIL